MLDYHDAAAAIEALTVFFEMTWHNGHGRRPVGLAPIVLIASGSAASAT